eukprot:TRINITY_DN20690_c0_g1_i3.p3 TRINITY_DN20690_c0_g1~~TRINITY_DN20690_c0_g1_i3.p3  ORF type:complete len:128 (+),score=0.80 TRINITY_DN20690_c0_g1_i3:260-643(+)
MYINFHLQQNTQYTMRTKIIITTKKYMAAKYSMIAQQQFITQFQILQPKKKFLLLNFGQLDAQKQYQINVLIQFNYNPVWNSINLLHLIPENYRGSFVHKQNQIINSTLTTTVDPRQSKPRQYERKF